jgi:hypothetical protein
MIDDTTAAFPNNIVLALNPKIKEIDVDLTVLDRPLRPTDPNQSVGVFGSLWDPNPQSAEIGHLPPGYGSEPTLSQYQVILQTLVKHGDVVKGLNISSILARELRLMLYRNAALQITFGQMNVTDSHGVESLRRWGIRDQQYISNEIDGTFVFVSTLDCYFETEMH